MQKDVYLCFIDDTKAAEKVRRKDIFKQPGKLLFTREIYYK